MLFIWCVVKIPFPLPHVRNLLEAKTVDGWHQIRSFWLSSSHYYHSFNHHHYHHCCYQYHHTVWSETCSSPSVSPMSQFGSVFLHLADRTVNYKIYECILRDNLRTSVMGKWLIKYLLRIIKLFFYEGILKAEHIPLLCTDMDAGFFFSIKKQV